jgi:hypothetical protein
MQFNIVGGGNDYILLQSVTTDFKLHFWYIFVSPSQVHPLFGAGLTRKYLLSGLLHEYCTVLIQLSHLH